MNVEWNLTHSHMHAPGVYMYKAPGDQQAWITQGLVKAYMVGSVQDCSISSALAMEILQSWTKPATYPCGTLGQHWVNVGLTGPKSAQSNLQPGFYHQNPGRSPCMAQWVIFINIDFHNGLLIFFFFLFFFNVGLPKPLMIYHVIRIIYNCFSHFIQKRPDEWKVNTTTIKLVDGQ